MPQLKQRSLRGSLTPQKPGGGIAGRAHLGQGVRWGRSPLSFWETNEEWLSAQRVGLFPGCSRLGSCRWLDLPAPLSCQLCPPESYLWRQQRPVGDALFWVLGLTFCCGVSPCLSSAPPLALSPSLSFPPWPLPWLSPSGSLSPYLCLFLSVSSQPSPILNPSVSLPLSFLIPHRRS